MKGKKMDTETKGEKPVEYLTVAECAQRLRVTRQAVYARIARGEIETLHIGAAKRIPADAFAKWRAAHTTGGEDEREERT
jgi:excisionase family DNA binding protein